jgi:hypothetical protein
VIDVTRSDAISARFRSRRRERKAPDAEILQGLGADDQADRLADAFRELFGILGRLETELHGNENWGAAHPADDIHRMVH